MTFIIVLLLGGLFLLAIALLKTYRHVSVKELKRQAKGGDELAQLLYRVVGYGASLDILLWIIIGLSGSAFFVYTSRNYPPFLAWLGCLALLWFGFAWMPHAPVTHTGRRVTRAVTPGVQWLLDVLHPWLKKLENFVQKHRPISVHTGLYAKEDLLDLIEKQKVQIDSRITKEELRIASHALTFGDKMVGEIMTPRRMVKSVGASDVISPLLMDDLHKSGHSRFPVYAGENQIVGTLFLRKLVTKRAGGTVAQAMSRQVYYVNENLSLSHLLDAFIKTQHHLYIVVNNFEEVVGVVTIEDLLEQIIGKQIRDEFDRYDDLRAVAALQAEKERKTNKTMVESNMQNSQNSEISEQKEQ